MKFDLNAPANVRAGRFLGTSNRYLFQVSRGLTCRLGRGDLGLLHAACNMISARLATEGIVFIDIAMIRFYAEAIRRN